METTNSFDIRTAVKDAVSAAFSAMLSQGASPVEEPPQVQAAPNRFVAAVKFSGSMAGIVGIHMGFELARAITAEKLGMEPEELDGEKEIKNLISDLSILIGEGLRSSCSDAGLICEFSTPSMPAGDDFLIESLNMASCDRLAFRWRQFGFFVEIGLEASEIPAQDSNAVSGNHHAAGENLQQGPASSTDSDGSEGDRIVDSDGAPSPGQPPDREPGTQTAATDGEAVAEKIAGGGGPGGTPSIGHIVDLAVIRDIPVEITVELGRTQLPIRELLQLGPGSAVPLSRLEGEPVDILADNTLIAKGVVLVKDEKYGIKITEITSRMERLRKLK